MILHSEKNCLMNNKTGNCTVLWAAELSFYFHRLKQFIPTFTESISLTRIHLSVRFKYKDSGGE